jgi:hypothetical protein
MVSCKYRKSDERGSAKILNKDSRVRSLSLSRTHSETETLTREREERESAEVVRGTTFWGEEINYVVDFEGSQAVLTRPSGRGNAYERNSVSI